MIAEEIDPLATLLIFTETGHRPLLTLGTSSDRIGTPKGYQCVYLTSAKRIHPLYLAPYGSINYSGFDEGINFPFGAEFQPVNWGSVRYMYDGRRSHMLVNFYYKSGGISLIWAWYERAGVAVFIGV